MIDFRRHPKLKQLARNLHILETGDCLNDLMNHAVKSVKEILRNWDIESIEDLRMVLADTLSVKVELIESDQDVERLAQKYSHVMGHFRRILRAEFLKADTEGLLVDNPRPGKGGRDYLAIVDSRGTRRARANFTIWHELAHLLLYPRKQLVLSGFRRSPTAEAKDKDPIESAVDQIAGKLAFWEPLFKPRLLDAAGGVLSFRAIEKAQSDVVPEASLYSACLASVKLWRSPAVFLTASVFAKKDGTASCLRIRGMVANEPAREAGCKLRKSMRVPMNSAISNAYNDGTGRLHTGAENQGGWEISGQGPLPSLPWCVQALRRGQFVYALLTFDRVSTRELS